MNLLSADLSLFAYDELAVRGGWMTERGKIQDKGRGWGKGIALIGIIADGLSAEILKIRIKW